ncbi:V-snare-domain-containing protein [Ramaria rubella]|nr:V-snare-domain-containing protein [Ramaria rubella]
MNSLYTSGVRQTTSIQADLERMQSGESSASLLGQISASLAALHRTVDDYDSMAKREMIKAKQEKALMRVQKFRTDYQSFKSQFERLKTQANNEKAASMRNELFASSNSLSPSTSEPRRRWGPGPSPPSPHSESPFRGPTPLPATMPNAGLRENHALDEHSFLQSTEARLDEFILQGQEVLNNLVDQRNVLKGTQKRILDAANTLGLSRDVIGWIERRSQQDMYIFIGGALFTFFCFYWIWRWFG